MLRIYVLLIFLYLADDTEVIDFKACKDVGDAFDQLFATCQNAVRFSEKFETIRSSCVSRAPVPLRGLLKGATDVDDLFLILAEKIEYFNWMNVMFLKVIANACVDKKLQSLIENYKEIIYSKSLYKVFNGNLLYSYVEDKYRGELKDAFGDKDLDKITVKELYKNNKKLKI